MRELRAFGPERSFVEVLVDPTTALYDDEFHRPWVSPGEDRWEVRDGTPFLHARMKNKNLYWWAQHLSRSRPELLIDLYGYGVHGDLGCYARAQAGRWVIEESAPDMRWSEFFEQRGLPGVRMWWEDDLPAETSRPTSADVAPDFPRGHE